MTQLNLQTLATPDEMRRRIRRATRPKGRQVDPAALAAVRDLIGSRPSLGHRRDLLVEHLHKLNDAFNGLQRCHLAALAHEMGISQAEIFEVATFYHHFEILEEGQSPPSAVVRVCTGLSCTLAKPPSIDRLKELLGADVRVLEAPCIGRCEQAPAALIGRKAIGRATADAICAAVAAESNAPARTSACADVSLIATAFDAYRQRGGYAIAAEVAAGMRDVDDIILTLEHSGLRGLGGAGFPAARKWRIVREQPQPRLMVVNIDEGEPGTFKDRFYLERDPHRFIEGMLIAARVVGISAIYIYVRDEYHDARDLLHRELDLLRRDPPFELPHIELRRGAGAYICGEESAMIESIEGKRGEPRLRPPYIAQVGLFGRPTLAHNFETIYWIRDILSRGAGWFADHGRRGRSGLRSFSVSGRVRNPGVKLAPAGITLRELVDEYCGGMLEGHSLYAYLPGGASGGILPASLADIPLDFDTLQPYGCFIGSGAIVVLSCEDRARDAALNTMRFFAAESCGQCTPCRTGTAKAARLMDRPVWDNDLLEDLSTVMGDASICGLGQAAPNPIRCVQKYFPHEVI